MPDPATVISEIPERDQSVGISVRLEASQLAELDRIAGETNRTRSDVLRLLLDKALGRAA